MTYMLQSYGSARPLFATNSKPAARRVKNIFNGCAVTAIRDGCEVGTAWYIGRSLVGTHPPSAVSGLYLARLKAAHGFVELPSLEESEWTE